MNHRTTWYPADDLDDGPPPPIPERSLSNGFRFVTFGPGAPYPEHELQPQGQPYMIDMLSGEQWRRGGDLRQPVPEDFLIPRSEVRAEEYHSSEQEYAAGSGVSDPRLSQHSGSISGHSTAHTEPVPHVTHLQLSSDAHADSGHDVQHTIPTPNQSDHLAKPDLPQKRSKSEADIAAHRRSSSQSEHGDTPVQAPPMAGDFFSPALGGLHRLPSVPQKRSKTQRLKRFFSLGGRRKYGRVSRGTVG